MYLFTYDVCFCEWPHSVEHYNSNEMKNWYKHTLKTVKEKNLFDFWVSLNERQADEFVDRVITAYSSLADRANYDPLPLQKINNDESDNSLCCKDE